MTDEEKKNGTGVEKLQAELDTDKAKSKGENTAADMEDTLAKEKPVAPELPDWAERIDFQTIRVYVDKERKFSIDVVDQGLESASKFMSMQHMEDVKAKEQFPIAFASLIVDLRYPVAKPIPLLGLKRGDLLKVGDEFIDSHKKAWREYRKQVREGAIQPEDMPETKLSAWHNAFGMQALKRIVESFSIMMAEAVAGN